MLNTKLAEVAKKTPNSFVDGPFGSNLTSAEYSDEGKRLVQLQNIGVGNWRDDNKQYIPQKKFNELRRHAAYPGDIVIAKMAEPIARACVLPPTEKEYLVVADCIRLAVDESRFSKSFIVHLLNSPLGRKKAEDQAGGTTRQRINLTKLKSLEFNIPDLDEQKRIAEILDEVDLQIEAVQIQAAKEKSILEGLTLNLYLEHYDHKAPNAIKIGKPRKNWPIKPLTEVALVERGKFTHRPRNDVRCYGGVYPFIQTGDVGASSGRKLKSFSQTLSPFGRRVSKEFPKGTVAITIAANIGDTCILDMPMCFPDSVVGIQIDPAVLIPEFFEPFLRIHKLFFESRAPQSAQKNINLQDLFPLPTIVPSLEEQVRIANTLGHIAAGIDKLEEKKAKLLNVKNGLLTKLIGGADVGSQ